MYYIVSCISIKTLHNTSFPKPELKAGSTDSLMFPEKMINFKYSIICCSSVDQDVVPNY